MNHEPGQDGPARSGRPGGRPDESQRTRGLVRVREKSAARVVALATVAAVLLFFATGSWLWLFLVPVATTIVYGMGGSEDAR